MPAILGAGAEDVADLAIEAQGRDPEVSRRLALLMVRNLAELIPNARPIGLNGLFKAVAKLAFWAMASDARDVSAILVEGISAAPPDFVEGALDRMESMRSGLFWEVNERVIAFDWVEEPLRAQIPRLRAALKRAKGDGQVLETPSTPVTQNLVAMTPAQAASADGGDDDRDEAVPMTQHVQRSEPTLATPTQ